MNGLDSVRVGQLNVCSIWGSIKYKMKYGISKVHLFSCKEHIKTFNDFRPIADPFYFFLF